VKGEGKVWNKETTLGGLLSKPTPCGVLVAVNLGGSRLLRRKKKAAKRGEGETARMVIRGGVVPRGEKEPIVPLRDQCIRKKT